MSKRQLTLGIAVTAALAVVVLFFIFNPFTMGSSSLNPAATSAASPQSTSSSGLVVQDETIGTGAVAEPGDVLTVNYTGTLQDGTVFDTSVGKTPFQFTLGAGEVIPGWDEGLVGMQVGGQRILIIPPNLAYGAQGEGPIPPNATLTFEINLLSVTTPTTAPASGTSGQ